MTPPLLLAQASLEGLPAPWNWIGLAISVLFGLGVLAGALLLALKLGWRPSEKPVPPERLLENVDPKQLPHLKE